MDQAITTLGETGFRKPETTLKRHHRQMIYMLIGTNDQNLMVEKSDRLASAGSCHHVDVSGAGAMRRAASCRNASPAMAVGLSNWLGRGMGAGSLEDFCGITRATLLRGIARAMMLCQRWRRRFLKERQKGTLL
jgi:hypothetical protein